MGLAHGRGGGQQVGWSSWLCWGCTCQKALMTRSREAKHRGVVVAARQSPREVALLKAARCGDGGCGGIWGGGAARAAESLAVFSLVVWPTEPSLPPHPRGVLRFCRGELWDCGRPRAPSRATSPLSSCPKCRPGPPVPETRAASGGRSARSISCRSRTAQDEGCPLARPGHSLAQAAGGTGSRAGSHWGGST